MSGRRGEGGGDLNEGEGRGNNKEGEVEVPLTCGYICEIGDRALTTEITIVSLSHID